VKKDVLIVKKDGVNSKKVVKKHKAQAG